MMECVRRQVLLCIFLLFSAHALASGVDLDVRESTTKSGIQYWYLHEQAIPIVSVSMAFKHAGSLYDPDDKKGLASLASSLVLRGTTKHGVSISRKLKERGVDLGISVDRDNLYIRLKTLSDNLDFALAMVSYSLVAAPVDESLFLKERELQKAEIGRSAGDPSVLAEKMLSKIVFGDYPHAHPVGGTVESVDRITLGDVENYRNTVFDLDQMVVSVVGDTKEEEISRMFDMYFSGLARGQNTRTVADIVPNVGLRGYVYHDAPQSVIAFAAKGIARSDENYPLAEILSNAMGGIGLSSVLMKELREKRGITYRVRTALRHVQGSDLFTIKLYTDGATAEEAVDALLETIESIKTGGLDKTTFNISVADIVSSFTFSFLDTFSASSTLTELQLLGFDTDYIREHDLKYRSVTMQEVNKFAKNFFGDFTIVEAGSKNHIGATILS